VLRARRDRFALRRGSRPAHSPDGLLSALDIPLDNISRDLLDSGKLASLIAEDGISGVTSNPTIFEKAIGHSDLYDRSLTAAASPPNPLPITTALMSGPCFVGVSIYCPA